MPGRRQRRHFMHHDPLHIISVIVLSRSTPYTKRYGSCNWYYFETLWRLVYEVSIAG